MASSDSSFLRLDPTQRSLLTGLQHDQLINLQNLYNVHLELSKEGSPTLQITGSNHAEALAAVQELISSKRTKNETGTNFASSTPTHVHYGLSRDDSESNIESTLVDVIDLPNDDQMEVLGAEEDEVSASEEDNGAEQHEDMWESVEVDSEFEGLSEEDLYGDMEVDLETVDEKPIENPSEDDSGLGGMRHHRTHHGNGGNVGQEANQAMIDALSPYVGKETMNSKTMDSDEDFVSDEEEAAYETKVERYNRYRQLNESQRTGMESDESDEDEDEDHMNRPARTRRPRKVSLAQSPAPKVRSSSGVRAKRTTSRVDSEEEDESDYDYSGPSARLRERSKLRDRGELSKDVEQLRLAVEKEFDVALDAKRKELELIETRMDEARALWERLQAVWSQRTWAENIVAPRVQAVAEFRNSKKRGRPLSRDHLTTARQIKEQSEALEVLVRKLHDRAPPKKRKKTEPSVARPLFCLTPNRGFVQVICPNCGRDMFGSHLGFINHCRLVHLVKFSSWDDAVELCGQPVDDSVVPMDDPARKESTSLGFSISLQKRESQTFRPPSGTFPASHPSSHNQSHALVSANQDASIRGGVTIDHSKMPILTPGEHNIHNTDNSRFYIKKQVIIGNSYKSLSTLNVREENEAEAAWMRPANDPSPPTHRWMVYIRPIHNDNEDLSNFIAKVRFYLHPAFKPRDIVEITKPPFQLIRESGHAWPVRIQVFFQDPRNKPMSFVHYVVLQQSLVEAVGEEYYADLEIDREFTEGMAVEDAKTNAAFSPSGTQAFSRETQQQRYQQYLDSNSGSNAVQGAGQGAGRPNSEDMYLSDSAPSNRSARHTARQMGGYASHSATSTMAFDEPSITYDMLVDFVRHTASTTCPLICTDPTLFLPYSAAKSHAEWCGWTYGKRKSSEWQRAMRISRLLYERYQVKRTTRELLDLCKHLNLTPTDDEPYNQHHPNGTESLIPGDPNAPSVPVISNYSRSYFLPGLRQRLERLEIGDATQMSQVMRYCRFCGSAHFPLDRIDELEIECGEHKLLILQESHSTFRELVERSVRQVHHFNESEQRLVLVLQQQLQVQSETPADTTMESQIIDNFHSASRPPKPLPTVGTYPTIAKKPLSNPSGADAPTDHEKTQDLYIAAALAAKYQSNQALMDIDASSIQVDLPAEGMSKADSRRYTKVNGLASPVRTKYPKPSKAAENRQLATPNRRGRPAKVSKHGALAPLLGAGSPAETPSTTPSKAIKDHAIPTTWQFGSVTEDSSTWTLEALCALPPVEFISFMTLISPSQHSLLPNLPAERLTILTDFLAESAKQPASSTTASSSSTPSATYAPNDEFVDAVGGQDTMPMDISRDSTAPTSPSPASKKQAPAVTKPSTGSNKPVKLGLQPPKTKKTSSTESSTSAAPNQAISDNIQGVESETSRGADAVGMEGDYNQETSNSVSPSSHPASTSQNQQNAGQKSTAERKEQATGSTKEDKKASTNASNDDSDWTPAQLNIIITYWKENPDKKSAPLPPHILEALLAAGETANSDSAIKSEPVPKAEAYTPSKVDKPKQTPRKRSVKKEKPLVAVASPGTPLTPLIPASVVQPKESPNPMSMDVSPTFSSDARKPPNKRSEYTETLRSTKVEHLEFRPLEQPSADAVPELQEQLNILQLDHATSNHANMILLKLMGSFARRLLFASAEAHALEKANEPVEEARFKVMVPLHVATAVINDPQQFDFLTDEGLARYTSLEMIGANALTDDPSAQDILAQLEHRLKLHRIMAENDTAAAAATATSTTQGTTNTSSTQNEEANG